MALPGLRRPNKPAAELRCAALVGRPVRYRRAPQEAWILDRVWRRPPHGELFSAQLMLRRDFDQQFGKLPAMPKEAFRHPN